VASPLAPGCPHVAATGATARMRLRSPPAVHPAASAHWDGVGGGVTDLGRGLADAKHSRLGSGVQGRG
jgi:hypothetical protein